MFRSQQHTSTGGGEIVGSNIWVIFMLLSHNSINKIQLYFMLYSYEIADLVLLVVVLHRHTRRNRIHGAGIAHFTQLTPWKFQHPTLLLVFPVRIIFL